MSHSANAPTGFKTPPVSPESFGDWRVEYHAATTTAAVFDHSSRDELTLTGKDRQTFLHGFCTNEVKKLQPGQGREAFIPTIKGKVLGHVFLFVEADKIILDSVAGANQTVLPHLDRYLITEDVQLTETKSQRALFFVTGPEAATLISNLTPASVQLKIGEHLIVEREGLALKCRRVDWVQHPGYLISVPQESRQAGWDLLCQLGCVPAGNQAWQAVRIQHCFPQMGIDITADDLAQEVDRTAIAISFHKGCYLGQEPIARIDALGHVNRLFRGIRIEHFAGNAAHLLTATILPASGGEKPIGSLTSVALLPTEGKNHAENQPDDTSSEAGNGQGTLVGLGMIRREHAQAGTPVLLKTQDQTWKGMVYYW